MLDFFLWILRVAFSILVLYAGLMLFKYLLHNGGDTIRDIFETAGMGIRTGCLKMKRYLANQMRKEYRSEEQANDETAEEEKEE